MIANNYYNGCGIREICHAVKNNDTNAVIEIAYWYVRSREIGEDCILVPIPQHTGRAEYTLEICKLISEKCGCEIKDVLRAVPHTSLYKQKVIGSKTLFTGLYKVEDIITNKNIYLIDNVVSTGLTIRDSIRLIPNAIPFPYASV